MPKGEAPGPVEGQWVPARTTHTQVQVELLGEIPNSKLQLPVLSPDGRWIAYVQVRNGEPLELDALFTGKGLERVSLYVQEVAKDAVPRLISPSGASWPGWSTDSKLLAFVSYKPSGRCDLAVHDVSTGVTQRLSVGLERMMMPAFSPSGEQVAVVASGREPRPPRLHVVSLDTSELQACPAREPEVAQLWPQWTADGRIVYVLARGMDAWLAQWGPGRFPPERICGILVPASRLGIYQTFAGLGRPLAPGDRRFAYYDAADDRIVLVDLLDGKAKELPPKTRAGCWLGPERFVAASDKEMLLVAGDAEPVRLMRGRWLPRGSVGNANRLILCTVGSHRTAFRLMRVEVISGK